jgi:hypothetical protein
METRSGRGEGQRGDQGGETRCVWSLTELRIERVRRATQVRHDVIGMAFMPSATAAGVENKDSLDAFPEREARQRGI